MIRITARPRFRAGASLRVDVKPTFPASFLLAIDTPLSIRRRSPEQGSRGHSLKRMLYPFAIEVNKIGPALRGLHEILKMSSDRAVPLSGETHIGAVRSCALTSATVEAWHIWLTK